MQGSAQGIRGPCVVQGFTEIGVDELRSLDISPANTVFIDVCDDAESALRCGGEKVLHGDGQRLCYVISTWRLYFICFCADLQTLGVFNLSFEHKLRPAFTSVPGTLVPSNFCFC